MYQNSYSFKLNAGFISSTAVAGSGWAQNSSECRGNESDDLTIHLPAWVIPVLGLGGPGEREAAVVAPLLLLRLLLICILRLLRIAADKTDTSLQ